VSDPDKALLNQTESKLRKGLKIELRWFFAVVILVGVAGFTIGHLRDALLLVFGCYLFWFFHRLYALESWVSEARKGGPGDHEFNGIWEEIVEDIKLMHGRYEKDRHRLQAVVNRVQEMTAALSDGVILLDTRARLDWWNVAATAMFGFKPIDRGNHINNIVRNPDFQKYFERGDFSEPLDVESSRREDQHLQVEIHPFGQGEHLLVVREVSRLIKLEQMRRDFVANVSHELRTPLTVIRGYVETLLDSPALSTAMSRALMQMQAQTMRMTTLINDLITLSKLETDNRNTGVEPVHLNALVNSVFNDARALNDNHLYENKIPEELDLLGSEKELRSALSNLIVNAVKYTPETSTIRVFCEHNREYLQIHVADNGPGIDPKHIPRLTERFYRVDAGRSSAVGGTGLGLAIVKHVLLRHDGYLNIRSQPGKGTTFTCCIPMERVIDQEALNVG